MLADSLIGLHSVQPILHAEQEMGLPSSSKAAQHESELILPLNSSPSLTLNGTITKDLSDVADSRDSWMPTSSMMDREDININASDQRALHLTRDARLQKAGPFCREYEKMISGQPYVVSP